MFPQPGALIQQAVQLFQQGDLVRAAKHLQQALLAQPKNFDALHILGVVRGLQGDAKEAGKLFEKAIALNPRHPMVHFNYAKALSDAGLDEKALPHHYKAIELNPQHKESWLNLGRSLAQLGRHEEAIDAYDRALAIDPNFAQAWFNAGVMLNALGRHPDALMALDRAIQTAPDLAPAWQYKALGHMGLGQHEQALIAGNRCLQLQPNNAEAAYNLGVSHNQLGQHEQALQAYERALALNPNLAQAWSNKGVALNALRRHPEALDAYDHALALTPNNAELWLNKGGTFTDMGQYERAVSALDRSIEFNAINPRAWSNKGTAYQNLHQYEEARVAYEEALSLDPENDAALENLGHHYLSLMNFELGWGYYDRRGLATKYGTTGTGLSTTERHGKPLWDGQARENRLLVWSEQGIGDQILYGSMLAQLSQRPQQLVVALDARLLGLFGRALPGVEFIDAKSLDQFDAFDEHISLASLGRVLRLKVDDFAQTPHPYLNADTQRTESLRQTLSRMGPKVWGLSWLSKNTDIGAEKSLDLRQLAPLWGHTEAQWVDLQYGDTSLERQSFGRETSHALHKLEEVDNFHDLEGLAALIMACQGVVTTSNSTVHLAGALNQRSALLVPFGKGKLWYWHSVNGRSLWYPSVRIFEQSANGSWEQAIAQATAFVKEAQ